MPRLQIDLAEPLHEKVDDAWRSIVAANDDRLPAVMVRGTELVRMTERGELEAFDADSLPDLLSETAAFGQTTEKGDWKPKDPPVSVCKTLLARDSARYVGGPRVDKVADVPFLAADRELATEPGVNGRTYLRPAEGLAGVLPVFDANTEDVEDAREYLLKELLGDFPFRGEADRTHALGLLLLPFVRDYIAGPTPLHAALAPDVESGKTTLAQACLLPGCGVLAATPPNDKGSDEQRKWITSELLAGARAVLMDNLTGTLRGGPLAAALTTGVWKDRVLGESRTAALPVENVWVVTGNNLQFSPEMARRTVPMQIEPGGPGRPYKHLDLLNWAASHRKELVAAALTLVEHWRAGPAMTEGGYVYVRSGEDPRESRKILPSFVRWAAVIGGILEACGMEGFLEGRAEWTASAVEAGGEAEDFLQALAAVCDQRGPLRFDEVKAEVRNPLSPLHALAPEGIADMREEAQHGALSGWLVRHKEKRHGPYVLRNEKQVGHGERRVWYVETAAG